VGKIGIPEHILLKEGELEPEERRVMEKHPVLGYGMIRNIEFLAYATEVVLGHHEKYDGTGYPYGLSDSRIALNARVFAIVDTLDAMTSDRPYRAALPISVVARELERQAGAQFDPQIVKVFLSAPLSTWLVQGRVAVR
jgi:HD-GYP domain-containing protein (c-di-GMP phosphodiesterase class II)